MFKNLLFRTVGLFLLLPLPFLSFSQEYPIIKIDPWTTKARQPSTYFPMVEWNSSPYKEFTYWKRYGPEIWQVNEYLNFRLLLPSDYSSTLSSGKTYPLLILLHGAGESGVAWSGHFDYVNGYRDTPPEPEKVDNNDHQLLYGGKEFLNARNRNPQDSRAFPGLVVFPQIPYNGSWAGAFDSPTSSYNRQVLELVDSLTDKYRIDLDRIYLVGLSNGARGVWDLINRRPDLFAAGIPISGLGDRGLMSERLAHFPLWIFQGGLDNNPAPSGTYQMIDALKAEGGNPRLTIYEDLGHGVWNNAFAEPDFFSWLLSKNKLSIHLFHGKSHLESTGGSTIQMGISPGFNKYIWKHNGEVIDNSDSNTYIAKEAGAYQVKFLRNGTWSSWSDPVLLTSDEQKQQSLPLAYRINVGSNNISDEGMNWSQDQDSSPSPFYDSSLTSNFYVADANVVNYTNAPSTLFNSGRIANEESKAIGYQLPMQGVAEITLYFTPNNEEEDWTSIFNVNIEGEALGDNINFIEEAGNEALKKTFQIEVKDKYLDIVVEQVSGQVILSGIEIRGNNVITSTGAGEKEITIQMYPNPFNKHLRIRSNHSVEIDVVRILDARSRQLYKRDNPGNKVELILDSEITHLPSGLYFLEIIPRNKPSQVFKIIKE